MQAQPCHAYLCNRKEWIELGALTLFVLVNFNPVIAQENFEIRNEMESIECSHVGHNRNYFLLLWELSIEMYSKFSQI